MVTIRGSLSKRLPNSPMRSIVSRLGSPKTVTTRPRGDLKLAWSALFPVSLMRVPAYFGS